MSAASTVYGTVYKGPGNAQGDLRPPGLQTVPPGQVTTKVKEPNAKVTVRPTPVSGRKNHPDEIKPVGDLAKAKGATSGSAAALEKIGGDKLGHKGGASNAARVLYGNSVSSKSTWPGRKAA